MISILVKLKNEDYYALKSFKEHNGRLTWKELLFRGMKCKDTKRDKDDR